MGYLNLNVHVVELEAYQAECPTDSGFYIPQDAAAAQNDQFQATVAQEAALPPQELQGVVPQQEQEQLMETVLAALLQDLVAGADVRDACQALPVEAETPFFYNFRDPSALDDLSTSSLDTAAAGAPPGAAAGGQADDEAAIQAAGASCRRSQPRKRTA